MLVDAVGVAGVKLEILDEPDSEALQLGREFGNRGQCNPTYFTVGNLVKKLMQLRDQEGIPTEEIIQKFGFITAGGCGPCRMGMYATEYRKALRDSGFEGFRVLLLTRSGDVDDVLMEGLKFTNADLLRGFGAIMIGDVLTSINLKKRPFEIEKGSVDKAILEVRQVIKDHIRKKQMWRGLFAARKMIQQIKINETKKKPIVHIMGEFWAKTTDGEGNYNLYRFIEQEGGVVSSESLIDWLMHQLWRARWMEKRKRDSFWISQSEIKIRLVEKLVQIIFKLMGLILGENVKLSNHDELAEAAHEHFDLHVDGGEDHMEVAHHIHIAKNQLADLIVSVKPFTCLSSSAVSDGVQSRISDLFPQVEFLAVETNGDGAANFYSRIQMAMHKVLNGKFA